MINKGLDQVFVTGYQLKDVRFRFFEGGPGSDANNPHTDYSNPYLVLETNRGTLGVGIGFSLGKGNEHICDAVRELVPLVLGHSVYALISDFRHFWRKLANPFQSRWIGPNCGPYHMAAGVIANAVFDLFAKLEAKPLWQLLVELTPDEVIRLIDFRYVDHILSEDEARTMLQESTVGLDARRTALESSGLPCYFTTWLGTSIPELISQIEKVRSEKGIRQFKMKVGADRSVDFERLRAVQAHFGDNIDLCIDANQVWSTRQAVEWVQSLQEFNLVWIEEPTAPDSIGGHRFIRQALAGTGIEVVTGENCPNSQVAAQFIAEGAIDRFQLDACRVLGPPENLLIMLIAKKYGVPVCPHAGGSGLDELVPHLSAWNHISLGTSLDRVVVEQVNFCSEYFAQPSVIERGAIRLPSEPGYIVGLKPSAVEKFEFPGGSVWSNQ